MEETGGRRRAADKSSSREFLAFQSPAARRLPPVLFLAALFLFFSLLSAQTSPLPAGTNPAKADTTHSFSRADTTLIIKHHFDHRQQIITGSVIMACMAAIVVVMNNYNPQGLNQ